MEEIARKLVHLFTALSAVGWTVFMAGFVQFVKLMKQEKDDFYPSNYPYLYFAWNASVVGPIFFLLATLHASLWRWLSSAVGSVTAFLGVGYISAIAFTLHLSRHSLALKEDHGEVFIKLWFAGGFLSCFFWAVVQALWLWYPVTSLRKKVEVYSHKPLVGISRKVVLPFIALSAVGWVVFMTGFIKHLKDLQISVAESGGDYYWAWAAIVAGLVLHILAVVHAVLRGLPSLIVGSLTAILGVFYILALGAGLRVAGSTLNDIQCTSWYGGLGPHRLLFVGSFLTCFFWAVVQAMWPWYATGLETEEELVEDQQKLRRWMAFKPYRPLEGIIHKTQVQAVWPWYSPGLDDETVPPVQDDASGMSEKLVRAKP